MVGIRIGRAFCWFNIEKCNNKILTEERRQFQLFIMAEKMQRRIPKWDVVSELHDENFGHDSALPGKVDDTCMDLTEVDTINPILSMNIDAEIHQSAKQSGVERNNKILHSDDIREKTPYSEQFDLESGCKDGSKKQAWEPTSHDRTMAENLEDQDKSQKVACDISPCHKESYDRTRNIPPIDDRSRFHRKRSRGRSRSRSLSFDSRSRSWSRSKSPSCVSKQSSERWTDKGRMRGMTAVCKAFTAGMCRRGNECRYLHEGGGWRHIDRHHDAALTDGSGSRHDRERQPVYESKESRADDREKNNYSREKLSRRHEEHRVTNNRQHQDYSSNERCFDFTRGKCFRGESCRYIHHDASFDGGWTVRDESRERFHDRRGVGSESFNRRPQHQRPGDVPCIYFLRGHCMHGEGCKFYHQVDPPNVTEQKSLEGSQQSFVSGGPAGNITSANASEVQVQTPHFGATNSRGENESGIGQPIDKQNFTNISLFDSHPALTQDAHKEIQPIEQQTTKPKTCELSANNPLTTTSIPRQNNEHNGQSQFAPMLMQAQNFTLNCSIQPFAPPLPLKGQMQQVMQSHHQNGKNDFAAFYKPPDAHSSNANIQNHSANSAYYQLNSQSLDSRGHAQQNIPMLSLCGSNVNRNGQIQQNGPLIHNAQSLPDFFVGGQNQQNLASHIGQGHQNDIITGDSQQVLPQNVQSQVQSVPSHVSNGQNHLVVLPQPSSNPQIFDSAEKNCELTTKNIPIQIGQGADSSEMKSSLNSDNSITHKLVTSEQAAKITDLSASLAQFFGTAASRNSQSSAGMTPQAFLNPSSVGSFVATVAPRPTDTEGSQTNLSQSTPKPNEQIPVIENIKQVDASSSREVKQIGAHGVNKEQPAELQNGDAECIKDDDSRKIKGKEIRMFKCALVEFVKDILKPIWKEGQLSKEAYKTIVKKVVDKVCGSLPGPNLPQTQEKIDLYLLNSKAKLSKLVQAYVEKFVNS